MTADHLFSLPSVEAPPPVAPTPSPKWTERQMLDLLLSRYDARSGNGIRYVGAEHVRSAAGFDARRTADFIAMDLWPSNGLTVPPCRQARSKAPTGADAQDHDGRLPASRCGDRAKVW